MRQVEDTVARLMRLSAGTASYRQASRAEADALIEVVDWDALATHLRSQRLLALLGERIGEIAGTRAPESFHLAIREAIEAGREQHPWIELMSIQVADVLAAAGIASLPLKGPFLGRAIYGAPGRRSSSDIDVLVASENLFAAVEALDALGYRVPEARTSGDQLPRLHVRLEQQGLPMVEVHWRLHWYDSLFSRDLLSRSTEVRGALRRAAPIDELTSLLLFYARDGFLGLRLACDLAAWWDTCGAELDGGALEEQARRYPELERLLLAATHVADQVVKVPGGALMPIPHRLQRRVRVAISLRNPDALGSVQQHAAEQHLVDVLLAPDGGAREALGRQLSDARARSAGESPTGLTGGLRSAMSAVWLARRYALSLLRVAVARDRRPTATT